MNNSNLLAYIQKATKRGYSEEQIRTALLEQGWGENDIANALIKTKEMLKQEETAPLLPPAPPKKSVLSIDLKSLSVSQILLYLGGLVIALAGAIYIGINWGEWGSLLRILTVFLPMLILYAVGVWLWFSKNYQQQAMVFIVTGSLFFPFFIFIFLSELRIFPEPYADHFQLSISVLTFALYFVLNYIFHHPIWSFLYPAAGLFSYYFFLKVLGVKAIFAGDAILWLLLLPASLYVLLGYYHESRQQKDFSKYPYLLGFLTIFFSFYLLSAGGGLLRPFINKVGHDAERFLMGWSTIIVGIIYLAIAWLAEKLKDLRFEQAGRYRKFFNSVGPLAVLGGIFILSLDGKKPVYETLLLLTSISFIFASIPKRSKSFLYIGTLFLVVYIFDIGKEYFQNQVGWPITLSVAGLISMGIGLGIEKLKRQYFSAKVL